MAKVALITGITGQDGSYLAELLLQQGYLVHGLLRRTSNPSTQRLDHLLADPACNSRLVLHHGDLGDASSLRRAVDAARPDEIYNLAAQSHVRVSFEQPEYTVDVTGLGALRLLEATRDHQDRTGRAVRFYQASSSEMFGLSPSPQSLTTRFHPRSPYGCAKVFAHWQTVNFREAYGMFCCSGVLFNHESPRRGEQFVTRKITRAVGRIVHGLQHELRLGNLDARRDWGHARDYVRAMWLMLQQDTPQDFVVATGQSRSVRELVEHAFGAAGLDPEDHVVIDPSQFRPAEVDDLWGDASEAREVLGWSPEISFEEMIEEMLAGDLRLAAGERGGQPPRPW
jgi:GDPmannose 4,6-dehydratase